MIENITQDFLDIIKLPNKSAKVLNYLLVAPNTQVSAGYNYVFPVGIAHVSAALKASGRNVFTLNLSFKDNPRKLLGKTIIEKKIDVLMVGGDGQRFEGIRQVMQWAKERKKDIITIVGGPVITGDPEAALTAFGGVVDYGVVGEGEITVNELAFALENNLDVSSLDGVAFKKKSGGRGYFYSGSFPSVPNLDSLPYPDYEGFEHELTEEIGVTTSWYANYLKDNHLITMNLSRGCKYNCTFCYHTCSKKYREMSIDKVFDLLDYVQTITKLSTAVFVSEMAFGNKQYVLEFCKRLKPYKLNWQGYARVDQLNEDVLVAMKESGCECLIIGIESAHNDILRSMRKGITIEQVENILNLADKVGIYVRGNIIFGDCAETWDTFCHTIKWWLKRERWNEIKGYWTVAIFMIHLYPGSHLYKVAVSDGKIDDTAKYLESGFPKINISKLTDDEYSLMVYLIEYLKVGNKLVDGKVEVCEDYQVAIEGICPHCLKEMRFNEVKYLFNTVKRTCQSCKKRVYCVPVEYCRLDTISENIKTLLKGKPVGIWAVSLTNIFWLLQIADKDNSLLLINKDPIVTPHDSRVLTFVAGKEIHSPDIVEKEDIQTIIVPNSPRVLELIKEQVETEFPNVIRVVHITELLEISK